MPATLSLTLLEGIAKIHQSTRLVSVSDKPRYITYQRAQHNISKQVRKL